jgi:hypothetical protein
MISASRRGPYLGDTILDNLLASEIGLVANQQLVDTLRCVAVDLLEPLLDIGEGIFDRR